MATIVNNPGESSDGGVGIVVALIFLVVIVGLFFVYVLPLIKGNDGAKQNSIDVNVKLPTPAPSPTQP